MVCVTDCAVISYFKKKYYTIYEIIKDLGAKRLRNL